MINIIKQEIIFDESLKQRLEFICEFSHTTPTFTNGYIHKVDKTNFAYIEPHKLVNNITYLFFNECENVYINTLEESIPFSELENHIKLHKN